MGDSGKIKERILSEIRNIVDFEELQNFCDSAVASLNRIEESKRIEMRLATEKLGVVLAQHNAAETRRKDYISILKSMPHYF